jgi:hypothetical protein
MGLLSETPCGRSALVSSTVSCQDIVFTPWVWLNAGFAEDDGYDEAGNAQSYDLR